MIHTYKILSLLLSYPEKELQQFLHEAVNKLEKEALLDAGNTALVQRFVNTYANMPLTRWQAEYVQLFDFSRSVSLHLFEHVHGDSRDRGQAMIDLTAEYEAAGLQFDNSEELPDFLPVFLEFLAMLAPEQAAQMLAETVHILEAIRIRLNEKEQPYGFLFEALISLSDKPAGRAAVEKLIRNEKPLDFDKEYDEEPVVFGGDRPCDNCK